LLYSTQLSSAFSLTYSPAFSAFSTRIPPGVSS
jgi:hypothetical protein